MSFISLRKCPNCGYNYNINENHKCPVYKQFDPITVKDYKPSHEEQLIQVLTRIADALEELAY